MKDFEEDKDLQKRVQLGIEDSIELNHLKKVNKKMNLLRYTIFSILFIIAIVLLILFVRYNKVNNILNKSYDKIKTVSKSNNYQLIIQENNCNYKTNDTFKAETKIFYKDGRYKEEWTVTDNDIYNEIPYSTTSYYTDNDYSRITVFHNLKTVEKNNNIYNNIDDNIIKQIEQIERNHFLIISNVYFYAELKGFDSIFQKLGLNVRTDNYNNEKCYVIKIENENNGYHETWISKEDYLIKREISSYDSHYNERTYSLVFDQVTDEDVDSSNLSEIYSDYEIKLGDRN